MVIAGIPQPMPEGPNGRRVEPASLGGSASRCHLLRAAVRRRDPARDDAFLVTVFRPVDFREDFLVPVLRDADFLAEGLLAVARLVDFRVDFRVLFLAVARFAVDFRVAGFLVPRFAVLFLAARLAVERLPVAFFAGRRVARLPVGRLAVRALAGRTVTRLAGARSAGGGSAGSNSETTTSSSPTDRIGSPASSSFARFSRRPSSISCDSPMAERSLGKSPVSSSLTWCRTLEISVDTVASNRARPGSSSASSARLSFTS